MQRMRYIEYEINQLGVEDQRMEKDIDGRSCIVLMVDDIFGKDYFPFKSGGMNK